MDPDANLSEQRRIAEQIVENGAIDADRAERLAELVLALDEWLKKGGFLPARWQR